MTDIPFTSDQLADIVVAALEAKDFEAVVAALRLLVVVDPRRAALLYDSVELAIAMRRLELGQRPQPPKDQAQC
jgi:hypothetical protein